MTGVIVHEWLEPHGGAEQVVEQMARTFPDAQIHALWNDGVDRFLPGNVTETWLAKTPLRRRKSLALPFMPAVWRDLGSSSAEWILCSSHLFAHHARFSGTARTASKFVYAHTPARYIWTPELDERGNSPIVRSVAPGLRRLDKRRAKEATAIAANSSYVRERIMKCWDRDAEVIYPPVNVAAFAEAPGGNANLNEDEQALVDRLPPDFLLGASRFVPYKKLEDVIAAGNAACLPVVLAGSGPHADALRAAAANSKVPVFFVTQPSHRLLVELFRRALAYVFPPIEDFGIMPVEAMAVGTPVIGNRVGGAAETVLDGLTGVLVEDFSGTDIKRAVEISATLSPEKCIDRAWDFDESIFRSRIRNWVTQTEGTMDKAQMETVTSSSEQ